MKIAAPWGAADGRMGLIKMQKCLEDCRSALGDEMELMVDCYLSWDIEFSSRLAERVRDCDVKWFEDPLQNGWAEHMNAERRTRINPIQVAIGNLEFDVKAFAAILAARACDVIQPEMQWCGGLTAVRHPQRCSWCSASGWIASGKSDGTAMHKTRIEPARGPAILKLA